MNQITFPVKFLLKQTLLRRLTLPLSMLYEYVSQLTENEGMLSSTLNNATGNAIKRKLEEWCLDVQLESRRQLH